MDSEILILTLDGGGIKGISLVMMLKEILNRIRNETNNENIEIHDMFDLIGGTSTGGLLSLATGINKLSLEESFNLYLSGNPDITTFQDLPEIIENTGRYSSDMIENEYKRVFGTYRKINDVKTPYVFVTAARVDRAPMSTYIFKNYENNTSFPSITNAYTWEAARCTSAAPTYWGPYSRNLELLYEFDDNTLLKDYETYKSKCQIREKQIIKNISNMNSEKTMLEKYVKIYELIKQRSTTILDSNLSNTSKNEILKNIQKQINELTDNYNLNVPQSNIDKFYFTYLNKIERLNDEIKIANEYLKTYNEMKCDNEKNKRIFYERNAWVMVDGGMGTNNPSIVALAETNKLYDGKKTIGLLLSLGCGNTNKIENNRAYYTYRNYYNRFKQHDRIIISLIEASINLLVNIGSDIYRIVNNNKSFNSKTIESSLKELKIKKPKDVDEEYLINTQINLLNNINDIPKITEKIFETIEAVLFKLINPFGSTDFFAFFCKKVLEIMLDINNPSRYQKLLKLIYKQIAAHGYKYIRDMFVNINPLVFFKIAIVLIPLVRELYYHFLYVIYNLLFFLGAWNINNLKTQLLVLKNENTLGIGLKIIINDFIKILNDTNKHFEEHKFDNIFKEFKEGALKIIISKYKAGIDFLTKNLIESISGTDENVKIAENLLANKFIRLSPTYDNKIDLAESNPLLIMKMMKNTYQYIKSENYQIKITNIVETVLKNKKFLSSKKYIHDNDNSKKEIGIYIQKYIHMEQQRIKKFFDIDKFIEIKKYFLSDIIYLDNIIDILYRKYYEAYFAMLQILKNYEKNNIFVELPLNNTKFRYEYTHFLRNTNEIVELEWHEINEILTYGLQESKQKGGNINIDYIDNHFTYFNSQEKQMKMLAKIPEHTILSHDPKRNIDNKILRLIPKRSNNGKRSNTCKININEPEKDYIVFNDSNTESDKFTYWNTCKNLRNKLEYLYTNFNINTNVMNEDTLSNSDIKLINHLNKITEKYDTKTYPSIKLFLRNEKTTIYNIVTYSDTKLLPQEAIIDIYSPIKYTSNIITILPDKENKIRMYNCNIFYYENNKHHIIDIIPRFTSLTKMISRNTYDLFELNYTALIYTYLKCYNYQYIKKLCEKYRQIATFNDCIKNSRYLSEYIRKYFENHIESSKIYTRKLSLQAFINNYIVNEQPDIMFVLKFEDFIISNKTTDIRLSITQNDIDKSGLFKFNNDSLNENQYVALLIVDFINIKLYKHLETNDKSVNITSLQPNKIYFNVLDHFSYSDEVLYEKNYFVSETNIPKYYFDITKHTDNMEYYIYVAFKCELSKETQPSGKFYLFPYLVDEYKQYDIFDINESFLLTGHSSYQFQMKYNVLTDRKSEYSIDEQSKYSTITHNTNQIKLLINIGSIMNQITECLKKDCTEQKDLFTYHENFNNIKNKINKTNKINNPNYYFKYGFKIYYAENNIGYPLPIYNSVRDDSVIFIIKNM